MIPLFRPFIPPVKSWIGFYEDSLSTGQLTNFGVNHEAVISVLDYWYPGKHLPVANGTIALEVALLQQCLPGSRVAIPDFTFAATANAVIRAGMKPVIFPCHYVSRQMSMKTLFENKDQVDAVLFVIPFGYEPQEMGELQRFKEETGKPVIFDLAGAWPMHFPIPDSVCCYSLHAAKSLPVGEGGLICFPTVEQREEARRLISFGFDDLKEAQTARGLNGKLDELHCSILRAQIQRAEQIVKRTQDRKRLILRYEEELYSICDPLGDVGGYPSLCVLRGLQAAKIIEEGKNRGIVFRQYYHPRLSHQIGFNEFQSFDGSDIRLDTHLALPSDVTYDEFKEVVSCVRYASQYALPRNHRPTYT